MRKLLDELTATHASATQAWQDYRARFEGVDKSLENFPAKNG